MATAPAQLAVRLKGDRRCPHHHSKEVTLFCEECKELICLRCLSSVHKSHPICDFSDIIPQKIHNIQNFINEEERNTSKIKESIHLLNEKLTENTEELNELHTKVKEQGEKLKQQIDSVTVSIMLFYSQIKEENAKLIQSCKMELQKRLESSDKVLQECKICLQSGSNIEIYDTEKENCNKKSITEEINSMPSLHRSKFNPNKHPCDLLEEAFGTYQILPTQPQKADVCPNKELLIKSCMLHPLSTFLSWPSSQNTYTGLSGDNHSPSANISFQNSDESGEILSKDDQNHAQDSVTFNTSHTVDAKMACPSFSDQPQTTTQNTKQLVTKSPPLLPPRQSKLLTETKLISIFHPTSDTHVICPTKGEQAWICNNSPDVFLLNSKGKLKLKLKFSVPITNICVSQKTSNIWACSLADKSIWMYSETSTLVLQFFTDSTPYSLCVTRDDCIIVGMSKQITKFSQDGQPLSTANHSLIGQCFITPYKISECGVTGNIAFIDWDNTSTDKIKRSHVIIVDKNFHQVLHRFKGDPIDMGYDRSGNLIIGEHYNCSISLLMNDSQLPDIIHEATQQIHAVGIDENNILWAVCSDKKCFVKVLKCYFSFLQY